MKGESVIRYIKETASDTLKEMATTLFFNFAKQNTRYRNNDFLFINKKTQ